MEASSTDQVNQLAQRLQTVLDPAMRVAYVRKQLSGMTAGDIAEMVIVTTAFAEARQPAHADLLLTLSLALADDESLPLRNRVASELDQRDQTTLACSLRQADDTSDDAFRVPDFGLGRPLTLGERKSLARRGDRDLIARVLRDPDPSVIRILLGNPALTENDVVRLCAARPLPPLVQREVFRSPRWVTRYRVKLTLVLNPYTPLDVALQLVLHLSRQDQHRIAHSEDLSGVLRDACRRRLAPVTIH